MKLSAILNPTSSTALQVAGFAANKRKATERQAYIMKCLRSKNIVEVQWARKQLKLDTPPKAIAASAPQKIVSNVPYTKLRVE